MRRRHLSSTPHCSCSSSPPADHLPEAAPGVMSRGSAHRVRPATLGHDPAEPSLRPSPRPVRAAARAPYTSCAAVQLRRFGQDGPSAVLGAGPLDPTRTLGRATALTFDDGPDPVNTPRILDAPAMRVKATFCVVGVKADVPRCRPPHTQRGTYAVTTAGGTSGGQARTAGAHPAGLVDTNGGSTRRAGRADQLLPAPSGAWTDDMSPWHGAGHDVDPLGRRPERLGRRHYGTGQVMTNHIIGVVQTSPAWLDRPVA
jgi:hypothetical protein